MHYLFPNKKVYRGVTIVLYIVSYIQVYHVQKSSFRLRLPKKTKKGFVQYIQLHYYTQNSMIGVCTVLYITKMIKSPCTQDSWVGAVLLLRLHFFPAFPKMIESVKREK